MLEKSSLSWRSVDIDSDPVLTEKYGIFVPVVSRPCDDRELFFPFDEAALLEFAAGR